MGTLEKIGRLAAVVAVTVSAVVSVYAGCRFIRERVSADFHYRKTGRIKGSFRILEFGWHMRRGAAEPIRVRTSA